MEPMTWIAIASFGLSLFDRLNAPKAPTPYAPWMQMQDKIMEGIKRGLDAGGYTFSDDLANELIRKGMEDVGRAYEGAGRRVTEQLVPYGNIGAAGRGLEKLNSARAGAESGIGTKIRGLQEQTKLKSYENLLSMGQQMPDPTAQTQLLKYQTPTTAQAWSGAAEQGLSTYLNLSQAQRDKQTWQNLMNLEGPANLPSGSRYTLGKSRQFNLDTQPLLTYGGNN